MKKILIVDDDKQLCEELQDLLKEEGFFVKTAFDAKSAQVLLESDSFDMFILDFKLPELDGIYMLNVIKEKIPKAIVFFFSGRPFLEKLLEEKGLTGAVAGIIPKPFDIEKMLKKIKSQAG